MDVNRRDVLLGLGTAAAGSSVAFGSGAFTQVEATRTVKVDLAADSTAAVALNDGNVRDFVDTSGDSIVIDVDESNEFGTGADGVNTDATIRLGGGDIGTDATSADGAFTINNNSGATIAPLEIEVADSSGDNNGFNSSTVYTYVADSDLDETVGNDVTTTISDGSSFTDVLSGNTLSTDGGPVEVVIELDSTGITTADTSLDITVRASRDDSN